MRTGKPTSTEASKAYRAQPHMQELFATIERMRDAGHTWEEIAKESARFDPSPPHYTYRGWSRARCQQWYKQIKGAKRGRV